MTILQAQLEQGYRTRFGDPFTGHIEVTVPFLQFTGSGCAVVLHKFMLNFATTIRRFIDMRPDVSRLTGHCRLSVIEDGKVCVDITKAYYNRDLGARSLANALKEAQHRFSAEYGNTDDEFTEDINSSPLQHFFVHRIPVSDDARDISVFSHETGDVQELGCHDRFKTTVEVDEELGTWPEH